MGLALKVLAVAFALVSLALGAWPVSFLALAFLVLTSRRSVGHRVASQDANVLSSAGRPWLRYTLGGAFLAMSGAALAAGGTYSPPVLLLAGLSVLFLPAVLPSAYFSAVVPVSDSVLLRSSLFPFRWYSLAEVKLEAQDQSRGVASMDGRLLIFAGRNPRVVQILGVYALGCRTAEDRVVDAFRRESKVLSKRGAHLLPLDSADAANRLSVKTKRLGTGSMSSDAPGPLAFDVLSLRSREGLVVAHRAYRVLDEARTASIPSPDASPRRRPLLAEVAEMIGERHGWPSSDEFSSFLAALDASRGAPLADRIMTKGVGVGNVTAEAPGGAEVRLSRAQLRAVARIYG